MFWLSLLGLSSVSIYCVYCEVSVKVNFFLSGYPIVSARFVGKTIFLIELPWLLHQKSRCLGLFLEPLVCFIGLHVTPFHQYYTSIVYHSFMMPNCFFFKIILALFCSFCLSTNFRIGLSIYIKYFMHFGWSCVELRDQFGVNLNLNNWAFWSMNMACLQIYLSFKFLSSIFCSFQGTSIRYISLIFLAFCYKYHFINFIFQLSVFCMQK